MKDPLTLVQPSATQRNTDPGEERWRERGDEGDEEAGWRGGGGPAAEGRGGGEFSQGSD
uniref:Uncharacterized protein n=1 Tax=Aegilops tauschii TaxID=37682 RepID=M8CNJ1_AEGTA